MNVIVDNVEVRGFESKVSKQTNAPYLIIYFEDVAGKSYNVMCKDMNIAANLKKGLVCHLHCELEISKYTKFELKAVEPVDLGAA
mgnify:CR=1 FL=1|jgi:hypothetical protein|nr:MAG TPA: hypothetical protein [Inoviridae sp.]